MADDIKKKEQEKEELAAYMKQLMIKQAATAFAGLVAAAVVGYIGKKNSFKK